MKKVWAVVTAVFVIALVASNHAGANVVPVVAPMTVSPESVSQGEASKAHSSVQVTDVRRRFTPFRKLRPGEKRLLLPIKQWKVSADGLGFDICGGAIRGNRVCEVGGAFSSQAIPFVSPAEAVTAADPNAKLVEIERHNRYLRLIFTIDQASSATTTSLPSGNGVSYGGVFPDSPPDAEEPKDAFSQILGLASWLVPLGTLALVVAGLGGRFSTASTAQTAIPAIGRQSDRSSSNPAPVAPLEEIVGQTKQPQAQIDMPSEEARRPGYRKVVLD